MSAEQEARIQQAFCNRSFVPSCGICPACPAPPKIESFFNECDGEWVVLKSWLIRYVLSDQPRISEPMREHLRAQAFAWCRLRQTALSIYNGFLAREQREDYPGFTWLEPYSFITTAASSLDALAALVYLICGGEIPTPRATPGISDIHTRLSNFPNSLNAINQLRQEQWVVDLLDARHKVLHRGFWPVWYEASGAKLERKIYESEAADHYEPFYPTLIAKGLLTDLESWDVGLESALKSESKAEAYLGHLTMSLGLIGDTIRISKTSTSS